jgi:asparagine synthase (glutamine-hydrolysing)
MCSISGFLATDLRDKELVVRMNAAQSHRGPDDQGVWSLDLKRGSVALGNTRLAIIDTSSAGHQPMLDPQTGNCLTYNGETYNFDNLSEQICLNPQPKSDTEVVLHAYNSYGVDAFAKLRGMFALAIWDNQKHELLLARDPFGIKPVYYHLSDHRLIFASELRALLATGLIRRKLSRSGIESYLTFGSVSAPLTIVEGVRQLLPGHYMQVQTTESGTLKSTITKFTNDRHIAPRPENRSDAVVQLRAELEDSVRAHLVSDVPLGVFLSGGMDSSALVALMSKVSAKRPKTFSVVFAERDLTEEQHSRSIAQRFNTDHCEIRLTEDQLFETLPNALTAMDQPTMDGINTYVVSQAVKNEGVTVALSGLGGDELFGGYPSFRRALKLASVPKASRQVLRAAATVGSQLWTSSVRHEKFWQIARGEGSVDEVYQVSRQLFSTAGLDEISADGIGFTSLTEVAHAGDDDVVNRISRLELQGYMANTLLRDTDAMGMAHSLEVRVPFVDVRVIDYVLSLPGEWKLEHYAAGPPKPLLADAVADLLPREFLARRKMGFTLPFERWMQGRLKTQISSVFADDAQLSEVGLLADGVRDVWRRFLRAPRAVGWSRPWSLFVLAQWSQINQVTL